MARGRPAIDMVGHVYGRLRVLQVSTRTKCNLSVNAAGSIPHGPAISFLGTRHRAAAADVKHRPLMCQKMYRVRMPPKYGLALLFRSERILALDVNPGRSHRCDMRKPTKLRLDVSASAQCTAKFCNAF
jgi:hypothetical protein